MDLAAQEAWGKYQKILADGKITSNLSQYVDDPVGFGENILGEHYTDEVRQVMESVRDHRVTIARSGNAVGKSYAAARIAVWFYKVFPDAQVYLTAAPPLENLRRILWGHIMSVRMAHPDLFVADSITRLMISRNELSFITGVAIPTSGSSEEREAKFSGKHAPHMLFIIDEGDAVPDEVYKGMEGCMSGKNDHQLIMFNPRAAVGPVYQKEANRQAKVIQLSAINHPNVRTGKNVIEGAVTRETTLRRINAWTRPLMAKEIPDTECWYLPEFLAGQAVVGLDGAEYEPLEPGWRKVLNPAFNYMVLGEYPSQSETQLISQAWIDLARSRYDQYVSVYGERPPEGVQPILGMDVAEMGIDANVIIARYGDFVTKPIFWKGVDPDESAARAMEYYKKLHAAMIMVDGTGIGSSIAPSMSRTARSEGFFDMRAVSVKVAKKPLSAIKSELGEFHSLRDQLWWSVREWLRTDPAAMLPPDRMLIEELKTPSFAVRETGRIKVTSKDELRDLLRRSPDRADALCLTFLPIPKAKIVRLSNR